RFYTSHGIPYKRAYLFHGVPGAGKTSFLQALAGKYRRNLCILQPTDPKFTDEKLQTAVQDAPNRSIIVLEVLATKITTRMLLILLVKTNCVVIFAEI
ncbi:hypothetical protein T484DRAFT_1648427, partial [Baffinella frigidus]